MCSRAPFSARRSSPATRRSVTATRRATTRSRASTHLPDHQLHHKILTITVSRRLVLLLRQTCAGTSPRPTEHLSLPNTQRNETHNPIDQCESDADLDGFDRDAALVQIPITPATNQFILPFFSSSSPISSERHDAQCEAQVRLVAVEGAHARRASSLFAKRDDLIQHLATG